MKKQAVRKRQRKQRLCIEKSCKELSGTAGKLQVMDSIGQQDAEEVDDTCKKYVGFSGKHVGGFAI